MIVCHCNVITSDTIETVISDNLRQTPGRSVTCAQVYSHCNVRPDCGGCSARICQIIRNLKAEHSAAL